MKLGDMPVHVIEHGICAAAVRGDSEGDRGGDVLVAPNPLKKLNLESGPSSKSGRCPKNLCNSEECMELSLHSPTGDRRQQTRVVLREGVCVDHIEPTSAEKIFALHKILPFAFEDPDTFLFKPSPFPHVT